ncbi:hypothetical protein NC652_017054 [Populus alba x Populus x berolinensis]|nr:hypothetical protein NC652_017054 [Populus alba x Populus x berolinensis]
MQAYNNWLLRDAHSSDWSLVYLFEERFKEDHLQFSWIRCVPQHALLQSQHTMELESSALNKYDFFLSLNIPCSLYNIRFLL